MTGRPVLRAKATANVLLPDPATPVTTTRRPTGVTCPSRRRSAMAQPSQHLCSPHERARTAACGRHIWHADPVIWSSDEVLLAGRMLQVKRHGDALVARR